MRKNLRVVPEEKRRVTALYPKDGSDKPVCAQLFLDTALANGEVKAVIISVINKEDEADTRAFGPVTKSAMVWVGAQLTHWGLITTK
jgi:hypothetical protein